MMTTEYTDEEKRIMDRLTYKGPLPERVKELPQSTRKKHPRAGIPQGGVRSTSRQTFFNEVKPKISQKQQEVYVALQIAKRPINNLELSKYLGWPINSVTPRVNELVEMGKVEEAFRDIYPATGRRTIYWKAAA